MEINFKNEFEFLNTFHQVKKQMCKNICDFLTQPTKNLKTTTNPEFPNLKFVQFKDMNDWDITQSSTPQLKALAEKVHHMVNNIGCPNSVLPMLEKIASGRIKPLTKKCKFESEYLGKGHFRWNDTAIVLTEQELNVVRQLLKTKV